MRASGIYSESVPKFLRLLDSNPVQAWVGLHEFTWSTLTTHPPAAFRGLARDEREDVIADLVERLRDDGFAKLRKYRNIGRPFANWLVTVAERFTRSRLRSRRAAERRDRAVQERAGYVPGGEAVSPAVSLSESVEAREVLEHVRTCMAELDPADRVLLQAAADGYKPRELTVLLGASLSNKQVSDRLRYLRRRLRAELASRGVQP